jgi:hypothetical protein
VPSTTAASWRTVLAGVAFVWHRQVLLGAISLDLFAVLLGGATAKNEMPAVSEKSCGGLPPMPMARKPWFRKPHR